jgi:hypothetical protein
MIGRASLRSLLIAMVGVTALLVSVGVTSALAASPHWYILTRSAPTTLTPGGHGMMVTEIINLGDASVDATEANPVRITDVLPNGTVATGPMSGRAENGANGLDSQALLTNCQALPSLRCEYVGTLPPYIAIELRVPVEQTSASSEQNVVEVEGANAPAAQQTGRRPDADSGEFGVESFALGSEAEDGTPDLQAGSHPFQLTTRIALNEGFGALPGEPGNELPEAPELLRNLNTTLPPGLVANVNAVARCSSLAFSSITLGNENNCPLDTAIGAVEVTFRDPNTAGVGYTTETVPLFNLETSPGEPARLGFEFEKVPVTLDTSLKTGEGYAVEARSTNTSAAVEVLSTIVTIWGVPESESHNNARGWQCLGGGFREQNGETPSGEILHKQPCTPPPSETQPAHPYLTLPTTCNAQEASVEVQSWLPGSSFLAPTGATEQLEGCGSLPFSPSIEVEPFAHTASTPTGVKVTVKVPQASTLEATESEAGKAEADIYQTTVALPAGMLTNAGLANGLSACPASSVGFNEGPSLQAGLGGQRFGANPDLLGVGCEAAKLGTVKIVSPLLERPLSGSVYLGEQDTKPFNSPLVLYLIAEEKEEGILVKLAGEVKISATGQLTTVFSGTPPVPFETLELTLANEENGERAANTTPPFCGEQTTHAEFAPYSTATVTAASSAFNITAGPGGSACPGSTLPFAPSLQAGPTNDQAGAQTPFTVNIKHPDGQQALEKIDIQLPEGVSALISEVTPCSQADAEAEACGAESLVGHSTSVSGLGGKPVTLGGKLYLTGALKATSTHGAAPFGLLDVTPVEVGPFVLKPVKVLSTLNINETTAAVTVESEQIPKFVQGIPTQLKELNITVERPGGAPFQLNPTNCGALGVTGTLAGWEGASSPISEPFYVTNCAVLPFKPTLTASTAGHASKAGGASFDVKITSAGLGQANIAKVDLTLPIQLPTREETLKKACTEAAFNANPASCGEAVIGKATIHTPIFKNPLTGPAYLVSHGGAAFPDIEFVLQGEGVTIVLDGKTDIKKGITYSRFESAPDAAFTSFETELPAGPNSILAAYVASGSEHYNLCKTNLEMPTVITAQDGAVMEPTTRIQTTGCSGVEAYKVTKAQLLAKALKACKKDKKKSKRVLCEKRAHKKYGSKPAKKKSKKTKKK